MDEFGYNPFETVDLVQGLYTGKSPALHLNCTERAAVNQDSDMGVGEAVGSGVGATVGSGAGHIIGLPSSPTYPSLTICLLSS